MTTTEPKIIHRDQQPYLGTRISKITNSRVEKMFVSVKFLLVLS